VVVLSDKNTDSKTITISEFKNLHIVCIYDEIVLLYSLYIGVSNLYSKQLLYPIARLICDILQSTNTDTKSCKTKS